MYIIGQFTHFETERPEATMEVRRASRGFIWNELGQVALMVVGYDHYVKWPGGGVALTEDGEQGLERECLEEIGAALQHIRPLGMTLEWNDGFMQVSTFYEAHVKGELVAPKLTVEEQEQQFTHRWVTLAEALEALQMSTPQSEIGKRIVERDLAALHFYLQQR